MSFQRIFLNQSLQKWEKNINGSHEKQKKNNSSKPLLPKIQLLLHFSRRREEQLMGI